MHKNHSSQPRLAYFEAYRHLRESERCHDEHADEDAALEFLRTRLECVLECGMADRSEAPAAIRAAVYAFCHQSVLSDMRAGRFLAKQVRARASKTATRPTDEAALTYHAALAAAKSRIDSFGKD